MLSWRMRTVGAPFLLHSAIVADTWTAVLCTVSTQYASGVQAHLLSISESGVVLRRRQSELRGFPRIAATLDDLYRYCARPLIIVRHILRMRVSIDDVEPCQFINFELFLLSQSREIMGKESQLLEAAAAGNNSKVEVSHLIRLR